MCKCTLKAVPIKGYEGAYTIDSHGNVFSIRAKRYLKPGRHLRGYPFICLCTHGQPRVILVHQLVTQHFIGPRPKGLQVNHKNGDKQNNCVENLEYVTASQNMQHAFDIGLKVGKSPWKRRLTDDQVRLIRSLYAEKSASLNELAKRFSMSQPNIWRIVKRVYFKNV